MSCTPAFTGIFPPQNSEGWTINFLERNSRRRLVAQAGKKESLLFEQGTRKAWEWAKASQSIRAFYRWREALRPKVMAAGKHLSEIW